MKLKKKLGSYEKGVSVKIHLSYEQIKGNGKFTILLTETPKKETR